MPSLGHNPFDPDCRLHKVEKIFKLFDANNDGYLNRHEMAELVMAVNPRVRFSDAQINAILNEVFRTYGEFIAGDKGLRQDGLLRTYNDGAGDVDRDFEALGLKLDDDNSSSPIAAAAAARADRADDEEEDGIEQEESDSYGASELESMSKRQDDPMSKFSRQFSLSTSDRGLRLWNKNAAWPPSWTASPNNGIAYADTWHIVEDLDTLIRRTEAKIAARRATTTKECKQQQQQQPRRIELGTDLSSFQRALMELAERADCSRTQDEAFDAHMAMGRTLFDHGFFEDALARFRRATELRPTDVRPYFRAGNSLYSLCRFGEALESYELALDAAHSNGPLWMALLPQIHVNLGVALEGQGMLLGACEHYREAAILSPAHFRALKLLGSALLGVGEYRAADKALREAILLKPDYADAHCDLGSVLHAVGDKDKAMLEFQRAIDLEPGHIDALYNLGGLLRDSARFQQAAETYSKVLAIDPSHWQAHLNKAVALLGMGEVEQAAHAMKQAFKLTNRVELYDEINHLKNIQKNHPHDQQHLVEIRSVHSNSTASPNPTRLSEQQCFAVVDPSRFLRSSNKTTPSSLMSCALEMRAFQKHTRFNRCNVSLLTKDILEDPKLPVSHSEEGSNPIKSLRKPELEKILRTKLLSFLTAETFQGTIKSLNERALSILDKKSSGRIDAGMFLAILAPICAGPLEARKRVAFDCLVWRGGRSSSKRLGAETTRADAKAYFQNLKSVYMPLHARPDDQLWEIRGEDDSSSVSFPEFLDMFEESSDLSFGNILDTLIKLEGGDRTRHNGMTCSVCSYEIIGSRFKEVSAGFSLCSVCYSEGKVPPDMLHEEYFCFKEYGSEVEAIKEKLMLFGSRVSTFG